MITYIQQDVSGKYLLGTREGLFTLNNLNEHEVKPIPGFESLDIRFILPEANGQVWVCTYGNGIYLIHKNGVTDFPENIRDLSYVHCIIEDARGYFWMPSNNGLFVTTRQSLMAYVNNKTAVPFYYEFSKRDGFRTNEFNGGTEPAYLRFPSGDISLASMQGLVSFTPSKVNFYFSTAPILVDYIQLDSMEVLQKDNFDIGNKIKNISFTISNAFWGEKVNDMLEYQVVEKNAAALEGQWRPVDASGKINLFSPSYGNYQLLVRKRKGLQSGDYIYQGVNFTVLPKWYQTTLFFICRAILFLLLLTGIFLWRRNYYRKTNRILKEKVAAATTELQQMNATLEKKVVERTLEIQEAEKKFRDLVEKSLVGVYIIDDKKFAYVNPRFAEIFGYRQEELIDGPPVSIVVYEPDKAIVTENISQRMAGLIEGIHYFARGIKKDGTIIHTELFGRRTQYEGKPAIIGTLIDITEKKLLEQEILDQRVQEQKKVTRAILTGEERERNRIGQELHDNISQIITGTKLYLGMARKNTSGGDYLINESMQFLDDAIEAIRNLSKGKVTPMRKVNLQEILQTLIDSFHEVSTIKIDFTYTGSGQLIEDDLKLNVYRVIQEQLHNISKHSQAKNVAILVEVGKENIRVKVSDNGVGFDTANKKKGIGIANMINRVEAFNGTFEITSSPGNGCITEINLPVVDDAVG